MVCTNQEFQEAPSPRDDWHNPFLSPDMLSSFRPLTLGDPRSNTQVPGVYCEIIENNVAGCLLHADGILRNGWQPLRLFALVFSNNFLAPRDLHISFCNTVHCKDSCNKTKRDKPISDKKNNSTDHYFVS